MYAEFYLCAQSEENLLQALSTVRPPGASLNDTLKGEVDATYRMQSVVARCESACKERETRGASRVPCVLLRDNQWEIHVFIAMQVGRMT